MRQSKGKFVPVCAMKEAKAQYFLTLALLEASSQLHARAALPLAKIRNILSVREIKRNDLRRALYTA
jgi:hypothetical protein